MNTKAESDDRAITEAATDGPWEFGFYNVCSKEEAMELAGLNYDATKDSVGVRPHGYGAFMQGSDVKISDSGYSGGKSEDNARYIAHFNPQYQIQILDERDELRKRVAELEAFVRSVSEVSLMESGPATMATLAGLRQYAEEVLYGC